MKTYDDRRIDELLVRRLRAAPPGPADAPAGLRRLAADAGRRAEGGQRPPHWWDKREHVRDTLEKVSRLVINEPMAAGNFSRLARSDDSPIERQGARVFGCLFYLTGHPVRAQYWWRFAGGADDRTAAFCLYLHHLYRGELREAQLWYEQASRMEATGPDAANLFAAMAKIAQNAAPPTERLAQEVDLLVTTSTHDHGEAGIAAPPTERLAETLNRFAGRS
ncbi:hypothetical protein ACGFX4_31055 [Kitasatospora sp. NPDC048365]|uniref:hypothetical protein n=1 Tax=Kitasatospora sp. NPDC048365 TaxID=3364050 RepID=UPI0037145905